jgi:hypothetical protein
MAQMWKITTEALVLRNLSGDVGEVFSGFLARGRQQHNMARVPITDRPNREGERRHRALAITVWDGCGDPSGTFLDTRTEQIEELKVHWGMGRRKVIAQIDIDELAE